MSKLFGLLVVLISVAGLGDASPVVSSIVSTSTLSNITITNIFTLTNSTVITMLALPNSNNDTAVAITTTTGGNATNNATLKTEIIKLPTTSDAGNKIFLDTLHFMFDNNGTIKECGDNGTWENAALSRNFSSFVYCIGAKSPITKQLSQLINVTESDIGTAVVGALEAIFLQNCTLSKVFQNCPLPSSPPPLPVPRPLVKPATVESYCKFVDCAREAVGNSAHIFPECASGVKAFQGVVSYYAYTLHC